jgi:putative transposase
MARPLRIALPGGLYHITSRGNQRGDIYFSDADREAWLNVFGQVCKRFNWLCHVWCQMSNHYHVVVETPEANLAQGMRQLNGVYTQYVNRTHDLAGHVFQGRYKSILVEKDSYLLELARYVVLNPLRAGMVEEVGDWPWSSYRATIGQVPAPIWLQTDWILGQFGKQRNRVRAAYMDFVRQGVSSPSVWDKIKGQIYLGSDEFISRMQSSLTPQQSLAEIPRIQLRPPAKPLIQYRAEYADDPHTGMALAYLSGAYTMSEVANVFGVHYTTVSRVVKAYESHK